MNLFLFCVMFFIEKGSRPAKTATILKMGYCIKNRRSRVEGGLGVGDKEFPGVLKKENTEIPGVNLKFPGVFKKNSWNLNGSWFLTLVWIFYGITQFSIMCHGCCACRHSV